MLDRKLNSRRINFNTSPEVDDMFRVQSKKLGMTMSEYFKHLVIGRQQGQAFMDLLNEQVMDIQNVIDLKQKK